MRFCSFLFVKCVETESVFFALKNLGGIGVRIEMFFWCFSIK